MDASQPATADQGRRIFLKKSLVVSAAAATLGNLSGLAQAEPLSQRYPDPLINILDPSFMDLRIFNASVEKLASGLGAGRKGRYGSATVATCWSVTFPTTASCVGMK